MDERNQLFIARGIGLTLALVYVYLIISCVWKYVITKDITSSTMEIIFIVMIPASIAWFARKDESLTIPKMVTGEQIPTEQDEPSKKIRKRYYFWDSLIFAVVVLLLNLISTFLIEKDWEQLLLFLQWSESVNIMIALSLEFLISVIVFYAISYVWEEINIKRYNRKLDDLEGKHE